MVDAAQTAEDAVVVQPDDSDVQEREQVGDVLRPLLPEAMGEASLPASGTELEDEQRDGDREDRVAEGLDAARGEPVDR